MRVALADMEKHNIETDAGGLSVRRGLIKHLLATDLLAASEFCAGFTVESQNTGEVCHYLFCQKTTTRAVTLFVTDDEYNVLVTYACGVMPKRPSITYAISDGRILINSPGLHTPIYGMVGGGLIAAVKVASTNPDTTALSIPSGICCSWGDRIVIAQGNILYVNDAGVEVRTFVTQNAIAMPSNVYGLFESRGALVVVTANGVFSLPKDALGQGQFVAPFVGQVSTYGASSLNNAAVSRDAIACLTEKGALILGGREMGLATYGAARGLAQPVGVPSSGDYRSGTIWAGEAGFWVSILGKLCHIEGTSTRWVYASEPLSLVGILKSREGADILLTPTRVLDPWGNVDFTGTAVTGVVCGRVATDASGSLNIRFATTASDNAGKVQSASVGGQVRNGTTLAPSSAPNIMGTSLWGAATKYLAARLRSFRHAFPGIRTDDLSVEFAATGSRARIADADLEARGQGKRRP